MSHELYLNLIVIVPSLLVGFQLFHPRLMHSEVWRATVTPLASIIGSGFLVLAPILIRDFGQWAVLVMAGLCLATYAIGAAIRWNIMVLDGAYGLLPFSRWEVGLERVSSVALSFAYVISVCYYMNLYGAFSVSLSRYNDVVYGKIVTTVTLVVIAVIGWWRGLSGLEKAEELSVGVKLAIIAGLLMGMLHHAVGVMSNGVIAHSAVGVGWDSLRVAFGLLITVQGFETSRYLEEAHDAATRVKTMRYAQWISAAIYIVFIALASVSFSASVISPRETAVIQMTRVVAPLLPFLLVVAALAAQFSAAVADTNGGGGLMQEMSKGKISSRTSYVILVVASIALTWMANIYEIISYASRAFAVYYFLQTTLSSVLSYRTSGYSRRTIGFALLALLSFAVAILGIPAD
ncbi:MAG: hypothetical protein WCA04_13340 [Geobacteraceae bacterium]